MTALAPLLLVSQLACGVGLVSVTLLFAETLRDTFLGSRGFDADDVVMIPTHWTGSGEERRAYEDRIERVREALVAEVPGAQVAVASDVPVPIAQRAFSMRVEDEARGVVMHGEMGSARIAAVGPGYFRVMGIPLLAGREFVDQDGAGATPAVVVSAALATRWFGSTAAALGEWIRISRVEGSALIIGVAHDVRRSVWDARDMPVIYVHFAQVSHERGLPSSDRSLLLLVKSDVPRAPLSGPDSLQQSIERRVPGLQIGQPRSVRRARIQEVEQIAAYVGVSAVFATVTIVLVALGVFAATSHLVARRAREIAIRQAVGATVAQARRPVAATVVKWWLGAVLGGILVSGAGARIVAVWQAGLVPMTLTNLTWSVLAVTTALVIAAWVPLGYAARVAPALLMRSE